MNHWFLNKPEMTWMSRSALKSALLSFTAIVNDPLTYPQYRSASRSATVSMGPDGLQGFTDDVNVSKNTVDDAIDNGTHSSMDEKYFALLPQFRATRAPIWSHQMGCYPKNTIKYTFIFDAWYLLQ